MRVIREGFGTKAPHTPQRQLALLFPPMIHPDGANITIAELDRHYETHHLPRREEVERLIALRDQQ